NDAHGGVRGPLARSCRDGFFGPRVLARPRARAWAWVGGAKERERALVLPFRAPPPRPQGFVGGTTRACLKPSPPIPLPCRRGEKADMSVVTTLFLEASGWVRPAGRGWRFEKQIVVYYFESLRCFVRWPDVLVLFTLRCCFEVRSVFRR
ncbi:unnamed protein product, partial [Ectocarpus sp. 12 AP-2014]